MSPSAARIRSLALEAGFDLVRIGPAGPGAHGARFCAWLEAGRHGEMRYLEANRERILEPLRWQAGLRSSVTLAREYGGPPGELSGGGRIARYAVGRDYHRSLGKRTRNLRAVLENEGVSKGRIKIGTDAVPILERALAVRSGIGFLAKSSGVISPTLGPYLLLSELLTPLKLEPDGPAPGSCGSCTKCLDACPTDAILAPFQVDARRCLSYTTIELRGAIPSELRAPQGPWLFGCDICLEVCPFTKKSPGVRSGRAQAEESRPHPVVEAFGLVGILELSEQDYAEKWVGTAMRRATRSGLRRNAAVVLGNLGDTAAVPALARALGDPDPIVRGHAAWALGRLEPEAEVLRTALARERDEGVQAEIHRALEGPA